MDEEREKKTELGTEPTANYCKILPYMISLWTGIYMRKKNVVHTIEKKTKQPTIDISHSFDLHKDELFFERTANRCTVKHKKKLQNGRKGRNCAASQPAPP